MNNKQNDLLNLLIKKVDLETLEKMSISPRGSFCIPNLATCPSCLNHPHNDLLVWVFNQITEVHPEKFKGCNAIVLFDLMGIRGRFDIPNNDDLDVYCLLNLELLYQNFIYKHNQ